MRILSALSVVAVLSGCNCIQGPTNCSPAGDAGAELRALGEPCTDGQACLASLSCRQVRANDQAIVELACLGTCEDDGGCASGTTCLQGSCQPTCLTDSDCTGRFSAKCLPLDAGAVRGFCGALACSTSLSCPSSATCIKEVYCCPPGAPCAAPPPGFCLR
jgi:hypothetical protein